MRAELKSLVIHDQQHGHPADFIPADPESFGFWVQAFIGPERDSTSDSFDFVVCTPRWLADNFYDPRLPRGESRGSTNLLFGCQLVLMESWSYAELEAAIKQVCAESAGPDWGTVANRVGRWLPWEFDYQYDE